MGSEQKLIKELALCKLEEKNMRQAEILNGLEAITELLYEVDAYDKEYSSQVIANAMEIIMEVDL
jgi:hypothetical protein